MSIPEQQHSKHCRLQQIFSARLCSIVIGLCFLQSCTSLFSQSQTIEQKTDLPAIRAAQIDLDYIFDADPVQQKANLDRLVERVRELGIDTVFLQAFADPDGNGVAESLYFPSRFMPLRGDLFKTAAQALRKNGVAVYAWLPLLAFKVSGQSESLYVLQMNESAPADLAQGEYLRLSPFNIHARQIIEGIYRDFSRWAAVDGILFHDDGKLSDFEDSSDAALHQYSMAGFPPDIKTIRSNRMLMRKWSRYKTQYLIDFSTSLLNIIREQQPDIRSARNMYASPVLQPQSEVWFAQSLSLFLQAYDYTALMAMPSMEKALEPDLWLERLVWNSLDSVDNKNRIIFELQSKNWLTDQPVPAATLRNQIVLLTQLGVTSFAYYPDDFYNNMPPADMIKSCLAAPTSCTARDAE